MNEGNTQQQNHHFHDLLHNLIRAVDERERLWDCRERNIAETLEDSFGFGPLGCPLLRGIEWQRRFGGHNWYTGTMVDGVLAHPSCPVLLKPHLRRLVSRLHHPTLSGSLLGEDWITVRSEILTALDSSPEPDDSRPRLPEQKKRRIPKAEAEVLVREYLTTHGKVAPDDVTVDKIVKVTGVSKGQIPQLSAWVLFESERKKRRTRKPGTIPLTDAMLANISAEVIDRDSELAKLILEQQEDDDDRRSRRSVLSVTSCMSCGQVEQAFGGRLDFPLGHAGA